MADAGKLHEHALQAEKHLEALATGFADAGANPAITKAVSQMAEAMRRIVSSMGKAQAEQPSPAQEAEAKAQTMDSATNGLVQDVRAKRAQEG